MVGRHAPCWLRSPYTPGEKGKEEERRRGKEGKRREGEGWKGKERRRGRNGGKGRTGYFHREGGTEKEKRRKRKV